MQREDVRALELRLEQIGPGQLGLFDASRASCREFGLQPGDLVEVSPPDSSVAFSCCFLPLASDSGEAILGCGRCLLLLSQSPDGDQLRVMGVRAGQLWLRDSSQRLTVAPDRSTRLQLHAHGIHKRMVGLFFGSLCAVPFFQDAGLFSPSHPTHMWAQSATQEGPGLQPRRVCTWAPERERILNLDASEAQCHEFGLRHGQLVVVGCRSSSLLSFFSFQQPCPFCS